MEEENYYIDSYTCVIYKNQTYFGQSPRVQITKNIFNYAEQHHPLHVLINELLNEESINGFIGFVTNNKIKRADVETYSIVQALSKCLNIDYMPEKIDFENNIDNNRLELLDKAIRKKNLFTV